MPGDEEPPTNGRLAIIMDAISEMPLPVQETVRARLSSNAPDEDLGAPLGLTGDEVRELIEQGQAILDRTIGSSFQIRYIGAEEIATDQTPEPEFPTFDEFEEEHGPGTVEPTAAETDADLSQLIAQSLGSLADSSLGEDIEDDDARSVLSETLREVGNLLRLASDRLVSDDISDMPLREALADTRGMEEPVTLIVENQPDIIPFFMAIQEHDSVQWAKLVSQAPHRSEFMLVISSMMALVRDLMTMEDSLRPSRLQMSGSEITVELTQESVTDESAAVAPTNGSEPGQRFEMAVDSFFGARHFIEPGTGAPHHHSYRVEATFVTSEPDHNGFAVGFANVRNIVDSTVMAYSETLLNTEDPFKEITPTTENLARVFHQKISAKLQELDVPSVGLDRIRVWESPTNSASYSNLGGDSGTNAAVAS